MARILIIAERLKGHLDESAWELCTAARTLAGDGGKTAAVILGEGIGPMATELAAGFDEVFVFDDARLAVPDGEGDGLALRALLEREAFDVVLAPHTNCMIDTVPALSARLGRPLLADCVQLEWQDARLCGVRTVYSGKCNARVNAAASEHGYMATVRGGAFAAAEPGGVGGTILGQELPAEFAPRRRTLRTLEPEASAVDISAADKLVGIGRGIEEQENLELVEQLADALGAELCASRPVVDKGWLPKSRQVGTSGVSVKPSLYLAVGISGSFQHMGGIKGTPYLVAINKDPAAPIFAVADVGIVGDLHEIVPALEQAIRKARG